MFQNAVRNPKDCVKVDPFSHNGLNKANTEHDYAVHFSMIIVIRLCYVFFFEMKKRNKLVEFSDLEYQTKQLLNTNSVLKTELDNCKHHITTDKCCKII